MDMSRHCNVECIQIYKFRIPSPQQRYRHLSEIYIPWGSSPFTFNIIHYEWCSLLVVLIQNETEHEVQRIIMFVLIWFASNWNTSNWVAWSRRFQCVAFSPYLLIIYIMGGLFDLPGLCWFIVIRIGHT